MKKATTTTLSLLACAILAMACNKKTKGNAAADAKQAKAEKAEKVLDIDMFIMSKCPYGVQAVTGIRPVLDKFNGQVGININYIGQKGADGALTSMHGEGEVKGDIQQLCAKEVAPDLYWKYMDCVNATWREIPNKNDDCIKTAGIDKAKFDACVDGDKGKKLLSASFDLAKEKGASGSPTIFIEGEKYQGGRTAQAIEQFICNKFGKSKKLEHCKNLEPPAEVNLTVITDKRCGPKCDPQRMIQSLKSIFMGLKTKVLDWSDSEAQKIAKEANITKLPALFFDSSVEKDKAGFEHMSRWLTKAGPYHIVKVKADFDPNAEICDDKKDNTGNGKVDCEDESCANTLACRAETKKGLELFVMSQCPFGAMAIQAMGEVLDAFDSDMNFDLHFIAQQSGDQITSMHGPAEVEQDKRWICAKKYFPKDYMKFIWCRAEDYRNTDWKKCATGPIKAAPIEKCATGDEGLALLKQDIAIANGLEIGASPTWVANGRTKFSGVTPKAVQDNFCKANPGLKGCEKPLSDERKSKAPAGACGG